VRDVAVPTLNDMPFTSSVYLIFCFNWTMLSDYCEYFSMLWCLLVRPASCHCNWWGHYHN